MSDTANEQLSPEDEEARQKKLERWATERVKPWGKPQPDDYDFGSWAKGANKELLKAGCIYEYARESHKLRCLLVLLSEARKCGDSEPFVRLVQSDTYRTFGGAIYWLIGFADQLADNKSFAELFCARGAELKRSLAERPLDSPRLKAIQLAIAFPGDYELPWPWRPWSFLPSKDKVVTFTAKGPVINLPERHISNGGSENIAIQIDWGDFTDAEIGKEMKKFARAHRPRNENCKEPRRQGQRPQITARSYLKALSAMRIWKRERNQWKRLKLVAKVCRYRCCVSELEEYESRCYQGRSDEPMGSAAKVQMSRARAQARKFFQRVLLGEEPLNFLR